MSAIGASAIIVGFLLGGIGESVFDSGEVVADAFGGCDEVGVCFDVYYFGSGRGRRVWRGYWRVEERSFDYSVACIYDYVKEDQIVDAGY